MRHTLAMMAMSIGIGLAGCAAATPDTPLPEPTARQLLTDFSTDLHTDDRNATLSLRLFDIRPMPNGLAGDVVVQLQRREGRWAVEGHRAAADYNQRSENAVELGDLTLEDGVLRGSITVTINPDRPRPGGPAYLGPQPFPPDGKADVYQITLDARVMDEPAPYITPTQKQQPPWRKDVPDFGGLHVTGTYTAVRDGHTAEGRLTGAISPAGMTDVFTTSGNIHLSPAQGTGVAVLARMSPVRVADSYGAIATRRFASPQDWSAFNALRITVASDQRRDEAAVTLQVRQDRWVTRSANAAALLLGGEHTFDVFFDDINLGNRGAIEGIGFGVVSPHGIGDVGFVVRRIELVNLPRPTVPVVDRQVTLTIDADTARVHNGITDIPKGLFGHHEVNHGRAMDQKALDYLRTINPGHLRPLDHTGFGFRELSDEQVAQRAAELAAIEEPTSGYYLRAKAADAVDNIVWCHTQDLFGRPAWMDEGVERWEQRLGGFYREQGANAWRPDQPYNVLRRFEVWNEPFFWSRHTNEGHMAPAGKTAWTDDTQHGYIPGELGADVYARLFIAASQGARSANPHVLMGGPSAPSFNGDDYGNFTNYIARFIDKAIDHIDFLTEHHYGGPPESFAASFEVATAYTDIRHNRRLPVYNTEANNLGASSAGKAAYNTEDILHAIRVNPDIYVGRALHALWSGYLNDEGELHAYTLLSTLRGTMLHATSSSDDVLLVASMPRPGRVVVVAFNRGWSARPVMIEDVAGDLVPAEALLMLADAPRGELALRDPEGQPIPRPAQGKTTLVPLDPGTLSRFDLPARSAVRLTFDRPPHLPSRQRISEQAFADVVLQRVAPGEPVTGRIVWRGEMRPAAADEAVLRVVTADVHRGEAIAEIGGQTIELPYTDALAGDAVVQVLPLDVRTIPQDPTIVFRVSDAERFNGFRVLAASVMLTRTVSTQE